MRLAVLILVLVSVSTDLEAQDRRPIHILTWNIYMRPAAIFWNGQFKRAKAIGETLKNGNYDIIFFQESFGRTSRKKLRKALEGAYPFEIEPKRHRAATNSGLWILSRYEIKDSEAIFFEGCLVGDCQSSKGAVLIEVEMNGRTYQLVNTHVQAEDGSEFADVRAGQFKQIGLLLDSNRQKGIPQFILGDLNTAKGMSAEYQGMLNVLNASDGAVSILENTSLNVNTVATWDADSNDLIAKKWEGISQQLDYALQRNSGHQFKLRRELKTYTQQWSKKHRHLSDHYAISLTILP